tara:strand:+ start:179 stop:1069 length:891 start_codon:yes stop_codon:yes gene_type:complete
MKAIFSLIFLSYFFGQSLFAQLSISRSNYIDKYHKLAIREMHKSGIPASITLAQGILESGNGNSRLAKDGNNHFGIKCHENWDGETIYADDDLIDECFRAYPKPKRSFRDHSLFLTSRSRYDYLFVLDPRDFKSWAIGLQDAGYATSKEYAERLINIIENDNLYKFDKAVKNLKSKRKKYDNRLMQSPNGPFYIVLKIDETIESFAIENGLSLHSLLRFNDLIFSSRINAGDRIYIQKKRKSFSRKLREFSTHRLSADQNAHFVSQLYSIQLEVLYRLNNWSVGYQPKEGDLIKLK